MPKLNLRDDGFEEDSNSLDSDQHVAAPPTLREVGGPGGGGSGMSTLMSILLIIAVVGLGVFALNYFKVIHLWGKKAVKIAEVSDQLPLPEAVLPAGQGEIAPATTEETPTIQPNLEPSIADPGANPSTGPATSKTPRTTGPSTKTTPEPVKKFVPPPSSGSGEYTVQVSSWTSKGMAEKEASRLSAAGMSAFVEDAVIAGENWYRVRVGRYGSSKEAKDAADQLSQSVEGRVWVAKLNGR